MLVMLVIVNRKKKQTKKAIDDKSVCINYKVSKNHRQKELKKPKAREQETSPSVMTIHFPSLLLILTILTISIPTPLLASPLPSPPLSTPQPSTTTSAPLSSSPPPPQQQQQQQQLNNIIDALIGAGDFNTWSNILSGANPSTLPLSATLFIPADNTLSHLPSTTTTTTNIDPFIFPYHIVPQRLSFSDLRLLRPLSRLPTLLPTKSILITNTSLTNFTLDNILLSHPDLYTTAAVAVHGIATLFDYTTYGDGDSLLTWMTRPSPGVVMPPPPPPPQMLGGEVFGGRLWSDAACLCREFPIVFSVVCGVLAFKIHRYPLAR